VNFVPNALAKDLPNWFIAQDPSSSALAGTPRSPRRLLVMGGKDAVRAPSMVTTFPPGQASPAERARSYAAPPSACRGR
jgi:hypothetical protein